jgi:hypothetical protein
MFLGYAISANGYIEAAQEQLHKRLAFLGCWAACRGFQFNSKSILCNQKNCCVTMKKARLLQSIS